LEQLFRPGCGQNTRLDRDFTRTSISLKNQQGRKALPIRFVIAKRHGRRGAGLGNEFFPWAKGWIASQVLDARLVGPSWGLNQRRYYRNFGTSRFDFLLEDSLLCLPLHAFTERDYRGTGEIDFGSAIEKWAVERGLTQNRSFIVSVEGMWGGFPCIRNARSFLLARLLNSRDALRHVYQVTSELDRDKLFVAVHMRAPSAGFSELVPGESARGRFNFVIPGDWYLWVCEALRRRYGQQIQFRFFTDKGGPDFEEAVRRFNPGQIRPHGLTECSDLLLMAQADLRICSVSSFSLAASFLSDGPYLWYKPQLTYAAGMYSIWGDEDAQKADRSPSSMSRRFVSAVMEDCPKGDVPQISFLGNAMDIGDSLPDHLEKLLDQLLSTHDFRTNLLEYGCLPSR
jgi:hypothetical protein